MSLGCLWVLYGQKEILTKKTMISWYLLIHKIETWVVFWNKKSHVLRLKIIATKRLGIPKWWIQESPQYARKNSGLGIVGQFARERFFLLFCWLILLSLKPSSMWTWVIFSCARDHCSCYRTGEMSLGIFVATWYNKNIFVDSGWICLLGDFVRIVSLGIHHHDFRPFGKIWFTFPNILNKQIQDPHFI